MHWTLPMSKGSRFLSLPFPAKASILQYIVFGLSIAIVTVHDDPKQCEHVLISTL